MANAFKTYTATDVAITTGTDIFTVAASTTAICIGLCVANKTTSSVTVDAILKDGGSASRYIIKGAVVSPNNSLVIIGADQKIVFETTDKLTIVAGTASALDAIASVLEIT